MALAPVLECWRGPARPWPVGHSFSFVPWQRYPLEKQIPPDRLVDKSVADALLQLRLSDVRFTRTPSGKYALTLKSIMVVTWNRNTRQLRHDYRIYEYTSRSLPLDDWVQNEGKILNKTFDDCVEGLVEQMVEDIRFKEPLEDKFRFS